MNSPISHQVIKRSVIIRWAVSLALVCGIIALLASQGNMLISLESVAAGAVVGSFIGFMQLRP